MAVRPRNSLEIRSVQLGLTGEPPRERISPKVKVAAAASHGVGIRPALVDTCGSPAGGHWSLLGWAEISVRGATFPLVNQHCAVENQHFSWEN